MKNCPKCNAQIDDNAKFCNECGSVISQPSQQDSVHTEPVQPTYTQPVQPTYTQPVQPTYTQPVQPTYTQPVQQPYSAPFKPVVKKAGIIVMSIINILLPVGLVPGIISLIFMFVAMGARTQEDADINVRRGRISGYVGLILVGLTIIGTLIFIGICAASVMSLDSAMQSAYY